MLRVAARHADIWSLYAEERSGVEDARPAPRVPRRDDVSRTARASATMGRSAGIVVGPTTITGSEAKGFGVPIRGSLGRDRRALSAFEATGSRRWRLCSWPPTPAALDAMEPVLERLDAG